MIIALSIAAAIIIFSTLAVIISNMPGGQRLACVILNSYIAVVLILAARHWA